MCVYMHRVATRCCLLLASLHAAPEPSAHSEHPTLVCHAFSNMVHLGMLALTQLQSAVLAADAAARTSEAALQASWPAQIAGAIVQKRFSGSVVEITHAAIGANPPLVEYVCISPSQVDASGNITATLASGQPFNRLTVNAIISKIWQGVLSELDANGGVSTAGVALLLNGIPAMLLATPNAGSIIARCLQEGIPDFLGTISPATMAMLERADGSGVLSPEGWQTGERAPRTITAADAGLLATHISAMQDGYAMHTVVQMVGMTFPHRGHQGETTVEPLMMLMGALAGAGINAARVARMLTAALAVHANNAMQGYVGVFSPADCALALAVLPPLVAVGNFLLDGGGAATLAREMQPRAGVTPLSQAMVPGIAGAKARALVLAVPQALPPPNVMPPAVPPVPAPAPMAAPLQLLPPAPLQLQPLPWPPVVPTGLPPALPLAFPLQDGQMADEPDVLAHFAPASVQSAARAAQVAPDPDAILTALGGDAASLQLGAELVPPRARAVMPLARGSTAISDMVRIARAMGAAWTTLSTDWTAMGPPADDMQCQIRLTAFLDAAAEARVRAAANSSTTRRALAVKDMPFGAADTLRTETSTAYEVSKHAVPSTSLMDLSDEALILSEHEAKRDGATHDEPIAELRRLVSPRYGVGPLMGKIAISSGSITGALGALPSTATGNNAALRAMFLARARGLVDQRRITKEVGQRVDAVVHAIFHAEVTDLHDVIRLFGGRRPGKRRAPATTASTGSSSSHARADADGGEWGDPDVARSCLVALFIYERWMWELYEAVGMTPAVRTSFEITDTIMLESLTDVPPRAGLVLAFAALQERGFALPTIFLTLHEALADFHIAITAWRQSVSGQLPQLASYLAHVCTDYYLMRREAAAVLEEVVQHSQATLAAAAEAAVAAAMQAASPKKPAIAAALVQAGVVQAGVAATGSSKKLSRAEKKAAKASPAAVAAAAQKAAAAAAVPPPANGVVAPAVAAAPVVAQAVPRVKVDPPAVTGAPAAGAARSGLLYSPAPDEIEKRAAAVAIFNDPAQAVDKFMDAVRLYEYLAMEANKADPKDMPYETCAKRALYASHQNCKPSKKGVECFRCKAHAYDAALSAPLEALVRSKSTANVITVLDTG